MKKNMVIFESTDRGGKDSVRRALDKVNDYSFINVVRGPIGYVAYNRQFSKGQDEEAFIASAKLLDEFAITIFLDVSIETLEKRCRETNEKLREGRSIAEQKKQYLDVFYEAREKWGLKNLFVVDNDRPLEETIAEIVRIFKSVNLQET
jgi:thymidylate kinase